MHCGEVKMLSAFQNVQTAPGKKPASQTARTTRQAIKPPKSLHRPVKVIVMPHDTTRMPRYVEGRLNLFRMILDGTSSRMYGMKKMETLSFNTALMIIHLSSLEGSCVSTYAMLYWIPVMFRSSNMPSIFALPMLARSM